MVQPQSHEDNEGPSGGREDSGSPLEGGLIDAFCSDRHSWEQSPSFLQSLCRTWFGSSNPEDNLDSGLDPEWQIRKTTWIPGQARNDTQLTPFLIPRRHSGPSPRWKPGRNPVTDV